MKFESFPRPKSQEELENQAKKAEEILGGKISHPDASSEAIDITNIKTEYKTRYDAYLQALRAERNGDLDTKEIQHAQEWIKALNNLDSYIKAHESKDNPLLRQKQFVVFKKIRGFLEQGKRKGYVKLPTGTGKTILFLKIAEALDMKTFVASPSKVILDQNAEETEEFTESEFGKYYGKEKDLSKKVTHITYHSLVNAVRDGKVNSDDIPVLILDEAHDSLGPERSATIKKFEGLTLGFTATPEYSEDKKLSDSLEEIFRMDVGDAIREGLNCRTQTIHAYTDVDLSSVDIKAGKYDQNQLEKVLNVRGRNIAALELYQNKFADLKAICNCSGVQHAEDVVELFNKNGISAACIKGDTTEDERIRIFREYKAGTIRVLTNAQVLLQGFNEQSCSVTLNLHPTLSAVDAEQRARSGRLDKNNPDKWNYVIDFIDQNSKKPQILYSEILGGAKMWNLSEDQNTPSFDLGNRSSELSREPQPPINFDDLSMDGLRVVVDTQKIMELTSSNIEERKSQERKKWTFETLQADVRNKVIKNSTDYANNAPQNQWLNVVTLTSMPEFPKNQDGTNDWSAFLGTEKRKEWTFETLQADVRARGVKSSQNYSDLYSENQWPATAKLTSMPEFPKNQDGTNDWSAFLGTEKRKEWTFETLQADVRAKGIKSSGDYQKNSSENKWPHTRTLTFMPEFPKNPDGSNDWSIFLGLEKKTFESIQADVRAKGIKSSGDYQKNSSENKWPDSGTLISMTEFPKNPDGSNDWSIFLGLEKKTFESIQADVRAKGIKSSGDYQKNSSENKWPTLNTLTSMPEFPKNQDGTNDWSAFLGTEKRKEWTFETLQADVRARGIKTSKNYSDNAVLNQWPSHTTLLSMPEFPKNQDGTNDWSAFLGTEKRKEWTFETLQADVRAKGVKNSTDYSNKYSQNQWPDFKVLTSMPEFPKNSDQTNDWNTFLGLEKKTFEALQSDVRAKGIQSSTDYKNNAPQNQWPAYNTLTSMPEFPKNSDGTHSWDIFLNKEKEFKEKKQWTFEALQSDVRAKGIKSSGEYTNNSSQNGWPNVRTLTSKSEFPKNLDGTNNWGAFLGRES